MSLATALVQHYDDLVNHLRRRFGDPGFAREVVHDVCVRILADPPREEVHTPQAFLRRVSVDLAIDRHRPAGVAAHLSGKAVIPAPARPTGASNYSGCDVVRVPLGRCQVLEEIAEALLPLIYEQAKTSLLSAWCNMGSSDRLAAPYADEAHTWSRCGRRGGRSRRPT